MNVFRWFRSIDQRLARIERPLVALFEEEKQMSTELDALAAQVKANTDLEESAVTLITGLADQLKSAAADPAAVQALADQLKTSAASLAAAVSANTPAAPASGS